ncbi:hypothetical protein P8625_09205 [Tenacibaculum tangerinum]|uniref:Outer membrane protein beta-barrel domain-containing protein n=1 Tax=Tenacibaculum tangerinum TaxID=3038772 RepID=A0ABY8L260_9FLAO|nr:outer membrane beta-barrel protein [Tenacibaculum tangerinum]WGH74293.1 hypothetical protein P8625_09205 [Tenacibaculum tangerinum]
MKKIILLLVAVLSFSFANAQRGEGTDWLKAGVHFGLPIADASDTSSFVLGVDLKYQFLNVNSFGIGFSTGYSHYFGKEVAGVSVDQGIVPLAALFRFYPTENFFIGTDLGYGFLTEGSESGGFYYRPEVGYHSDKWNIYGFYQGLSVDGSTPSSVGIGINYNIIQGK